MKESIRKSRRTANDLVSSQSAFKQAKEALQGGQNEQFLKKTAEGLELLRESKKNYSDARSDTIRIVERSGKVLAPESWDPKLAAEIAQRLWEARPELTKPLQDLAKIGDTSEDQENLLKIKYGLNHNIAAVHAQLEQLYEQSLHVNHKPAVDAANLNTAKSSKAPVPVNPVPTKPVTASPQKLTPQEKAAGLAASSPPVASQPNSSKATSPAYPSVNSQSQTRQSVPTTSYPPYVGTDMPAPGPPSPPTTPTNPPVVPATPEASDSSAQSETIAAIDQRIRSTPPPKLQPIPDTSDGEPSAVSPNASQPSIPSRTGAQGGGSQQDAENLYQRWHDSGDRAFSSAAEQNLFYQNHPELFEIRNRRQCSCEICFAGI